MTDEELMAAWDLWFDLAQATHDHDPLWTHGVFVRIEALGASAERSNAGSEAPSAEPAD